MSPRRKVAVRWLCAAGLLLFAPVLAGAEGASDHDALTRLAQERLSQLPALWQQQDYGRAAALLEDLRATPGMDGLGQVWIGIHYNLACAYSLLHENGKALAALEQAIAAGYRDYGHLRQDPDLDPLRADPRFDFLVAGLRAEDQRWNSAVWTTPYRDPLTEEERLAGLARVWSEVKFGFAGFRRAPAVDWDSLCVSYLPRVRQAESTLAYYRLLQEMCARLRDGHTGVNVPAALFAELYSRPPLDARLVEDRVLVTAVLSDSLRRSGILPGCEITAVDGVPVKEYAERQVAPYVNAASEQGRALALYGLYLLCGPPARPVELALRDVRGRAVTRTLDRSYRRILSPAPAVEFRRLGDGTAYVALNTFAEERVVSLFDSVFAEVAKSRALILDLRRNTGGNSDRGFRILGCLTGRPFAIPRCASRPYDAYRRTAGHPEGRRELSQREWPPDSSRRYERPVALLIGPQTGSAAEDFCLAFDVMRRGLLVGEPTAGSTGQPLIYALPGGGSGFVCTLDCTYPDGTEFVGRGLVPDIVVRPTVEDVRTGRDRALQAARDQLAVRARPRRNQ